MSRSAASLIRLRALTFLEIASDLSIVRPSSTFFEYSSFIRMNSDREAGGLEPMPIGMASAIGRIEGSLVVWGVRVHGADVPGRWVLVGGRLVRV